MNRSIAGKLTLRIALLLAVTLCLLFFGSYHIVSRIIRNETESFTKSTVSIYADMIQYESEGMHLPINESFSEFIVFIGDYLCDWYRVDYTYMFTPDPENGQIRIIGVSTGSDFDAPAASSFPTGAVLEHSFSKEALELYDGSRNYFVFENDTFENGFDTVTAITDFTGTRIFVGVGFLSTIFKAPCGANFRLSRSSSFSVSSL